MRMTSPVVEPTAAAVPNPAPEPFFALVGNPNSGKTTLFNALTGLRQKVGNYPGVTVERKEGRFFTQHGKPVRLLDLPGCYSLAARSPDEAITQEILFGWRQDVPALDGVICVVDAGNLERNLYLVTQIIELGLPVIVALNMMDEAKRRGVAVEARRLEQELGVPVVPMEAHQGKGIIPLRLALSRKVEPSRAWRPVRTAWILPALAAIADQLDPDSRLSRSQAEAEAALLLVDGIPEVVRQGREPVSEAVTAEVQRWQGELTQVRPNWQADFVAERYRRLEELAHAVVGEGMASASWTDRIDKVLLHPVWGGSALAAALWLLFYSVFELAVPFMDGIDTVTGWVSETAQRLVPAGLLQDLIVDGIIAGVGGILIFLPQIILLFFFISLLESTGYLARAAFMLDRFMSRVGLQGRAFIPLLSSYACAIPGIMAARTIDSPRDRLATIFIAPWMSCAARLPVYLVLIAALVPDGAHQSAIQAGLLWGLYVLGTLAAFALAWVLKKTTLREKGGGLALELPPYRWPQPKYIFREMVERSMIFVRRAGTIILALSILLWVLMTFPNYQAEDPSEKLQSSFAGQVGQAIEPTIEPLGYDWKIGLGLMASFAAREVFVSTMSIVYAVEEGVDEEQGVVDAMRNQVDEAGNLVYTPLTLASLMVFFVFALQCLSTVAIVKRETNSWTWPLAQLVVMTGAAYLFALIVYQGGRALGWS